MIFEELSIQELDYLTLFNGKSIDINEYLILHNKAIKIATDIYLKYYEKEKSLKDNINNLKVKAIEKMPSALHYQYRARALYLPDDKTIYLYEKDIEDIYSLLMKNKRNLSIKDIRLVMIAHELFHHLEYIYDIDFKELMKEDLNEDEDYNNYREIAAHHFAYLITDTYPEMFDYYWLEYYYNRALNKYHDYYNNLSTKIGEELND